MLSPLFFGSKLTGYVKTDQYNDYAEMTLPAATTISAAAVNPGMGIYSSPMLAALMTIFNARLGFWTINPRKVFKKRTLPWWPTYFFKELFFNIGLSNKMINISDGGHIENLAAYELIRRGCRLIICTDAGEDAKYSFYDLENLIIRVRNELGVEIRFREDSQPEEVIRPKSSVGYSDRHFAIADMYLVYYDENNPKIDLKDFDKAKSTLENDGEVKIGTFVYIKSSITVSNPLKDKQLAAEFSESELKKMSASEIIKKIKLRQDAIDYKIFHPAFPHEPTSDQFFDETQWEAYFQLGQQMGADILGVSGKKRKEGSHEPLFKYYDYNTAPKFTIEQLIAHFDKGDKKLEYGEASNHWRKA